jgi:hypothetical protein
MRLVVDVEAGSVAIGPKRLHRQWVDLYAVLARARPSFVGPEAIARVGFWRTKRLASVGKEISRHLAWLKQNGLGNVLEDHGRTRAWRLCVAPALVRLRPTPDTVQAWIDRRSEGAASWESWAEALERLVEASLALQHGEAEAALEQLQPEELFSCDPALEAWAALLRGRAAAQHDEIALLKRLCRGWFSRSDAVGRTVGARLRALVELGERFHDSAAALRRLKKLAAALEQRDDVGALGSVLNVMGLLARRADDARSGWSYHLRSAPLFGISGDFPSLEGSLFNLAKARHMLLEQSQRPPDKAVLQLVELSRRICRRMGVGGASAQSEIFGARCAFEMGDIPLARAYMAEADALVKRIESTFDQACFLLLRAEIEHQHPTGATDPLRDLRAAERLFLKAGDKTSAAHARRLRTLWSRSRPLSAQPPSPAPAE